MTDKIIHTLMVVAVSAIALVPVPLLMLGFEPVAKASVIVGVVSGLIGMGFIIREFWRGP